MPQGGIELLKALGILLSGFFDSASFGCASEGVIRWVQLGVLPPGQAGNPQLIESLQGVTFGADLFQYVVDQIGVRDVEAVAGG